MALAVEQYVVCVVREEVEGVEVRRLAEVGLGRKLKVLLLKLASDGALVAEDEVNLQRAFQVSKHVTNASSSTGATDRDCDCDIPSCQGRSSRDQT